MEVLTDQSVSELILKLIVENERLNSEIQNLKEINADLYSEIEDKNYVITGLKTIVANLGG